jgi:hypothetical protein
MAKKKTFVAGEVVLFQRSPGAPWELGTYQQPDNIPGWHYVRDDTGWSERHFAPLRRLKPSPGPRKEGTLKSTRETLKSFRDA